jgi:hypothetical protein
MSQEQTVEECIAAKKAAGMTEEEARAACTPKPAGETQESKGKPASPPVPAPPPNLTEQILAVMKEYGKAISEQVKHEIMVEMDKVVKETRVEAVNAIKKGLGLEKDPVIHLSEIEGIVRKVVLDNTDPGKRTETETPDKPTEGPDLNKEKDVKALDDQFNAMLKKRGTVF